MGEMAAGPALAPQRPDALGNRRGGGAQHAGGTRRTVDHAGLPFGPVAFDPAQRHDLRRHATDPRRMGLAKTALDHR